MTDLRIAISGDGVNLFAGERLLGAIPSDNVSHDDGTTNLTIPLDLLADHQVSQALRLALGKKDEEEIVGRVWVFLAEHAPHVTEVTFDWGSEYDDEGGSYRYATSDLGDEDLEDAYDDWLDLLNEIDADTFEFGTRKRPD